MKFKLSQLSCNFHSIKTCRNDGSLLLHTAAWPPCKAGLGEGQPSARTYSSADKSVGYRQFYYHFKCSDSQLLFSFNFSFYTTPSTLRNWFMLVVELTPFSCKNNCTRLTQFHAKSSKRKFPDQENVPWGISSQSHSFVKRYWF